MNRNRLTAVAAGVLAALALTGCGGNDAPARTDVPVTTAPATTGTSTAEPTPAATAAPSGGAVVAPEVVEAVGQDRAQAVAETAEHFTGTAMSRCTEPLADTLGALQDLMTPDAYAEAQGNPGGVILEVQADAPSDCVRRTDVTVALAVDGPFVLALATAVQERTALRDGQPAGLRVTRTYDLRMQPTADGGWVVTALTADAATAEPLD